MKVSSASSATGVASLSRRQQWNDLLADWRASEDPALRCARLNAQLALGGDGYCLFLV